MGSERGGAPRPDGASWAECSFNLSEDERRAWVFHDFLADPHESAIEGLESVVSISLIWLDASQRCEGEFFVHFQSDDRSRNPRLEISSGLALIEQGWAILDGISRLAQRDRDWARAPNVDAALSFNQMGFSRASLRELLLGLGLFETRSGATPEARRAEIQAQRHARQIALVCPQNRADSVPQARRI